MKTINTDELNQAIELHKLWLDGDPKGKRLQLDYYNLEQVDLSYTDLRKAVIRGTNLRRANLVGANLSRANLSDTDLSEALLIEANLTQVAAGGATFWRANLTDANLTDAFLFEADLSEAILYDARLQGANIDDATLPNYNIVPTTGAFVGWSKVTETIVAKLKIPARAKRTSVLNSRRCRASKVVILGFYDCDGKRLNSNVKVESFTKGDTVIAPDYNDDIRVLRAGGIHFYLSFQEAIQSPKVFCYSADKSDVSSDDAATTAKGNKT